MSAMPVSMGYDGHRAIVTFTDGYVMVFESRFPNPFMKKGGCKIVHVSHNGVEIFRFRNGYRDDGSRDDYYWILFLVKRYSQQQMGEMWEAAWVYVNNAWHDTRNPSYTVANCHWTICVEATMADMGRHQLERGEARTKDE